jgi:hypothetical protein
MGVGHYFVIAPICVKGLWHIDKCPPISTMQCSTLQINTSVKCTTNINTHKMTIGTPTPYYYSFLVKF